MSTDRITGLTSPRPGTPTTSADDKTLGKTGGADFSATFRLQVAALKSQSLQILASSTQATASTNTTSALDTLGGATLAAPTQQSSPMTIPGMSATGRITSLHDPESAYRMMSIINQAEATYTGQRNSLTQMRDMLRELRQEAHALVKEAKNPESDVQTLSTALGQFKEAYNTWISTFSNDLANGGVLHGNQAATVVRSGLRNIVTDIFHGAAHGFQGLGDLGLTINGNDQLANFSTKEFAQTAAQKIDAVRDTINQFAVRFEQATTLFAASGNFIDNRQNNLQRALEFIASNKPALQAEFGLGDPAKPVGNSPPARAALASYNKTASA